MLSAAVTVDGKPWKPQRDDHVPRSAAPAAHRLRSRSSLSDLTLPTLPFVLVSNIRRGPDGKTWDQWLIDRHDADTTGSVRQQFRQVEEALRSFVGELGPGNLDRVRHTGSSHKRAERSEPVVELAWVGPDQIPAPFSEDAQLRLRRLLQETARRFGKQLLLTSHVHSFDGLSVRRVSKQDETTVIERSTPTADPGEGETPQARISALHRAYAQAGSPSAEFVSGSGILKLPGSVIQTMELPEHLIFSPLENGGFIAAPDSLLRRWRAALEGEE